MLSCPQCKSRNIFHEHHPYYMTRRWCMNCRYVWEEGKVHHPQPLCEVEAEMVECRDCCLLTRADDGDNRVDIWCGYMVDGEPFMEGCNMVDYKGECRYFVQAESD